ncbi:response regulator transcription factor [uncultured Shewanella sp.]|uniref:response regulator transcription factor n=1 Tax=uncultured Shewanella sp. TaxID=173975 RepID=UPI00260C5C9D|nr:response regulator transcription factor [uncultured Shewanella sp.]
MLNLLLVEDDIDLAATIIDYFELESMQCDHATNGLAGLHFIEQQAYSALIIDINLPKMDGLTLCNTLREKGIDTPVLMLTARDSLDNKIEGFQSGADDYLVKPFAMAELIVRIQTLSKRRSGQVKKLRLADLEIDLADKKAYRHNDPLKLSPTAFRILDVLLRASPNPVSRHQIMQNIWGDDQPDSNSLKVHIHHLRKQLDGQHSPKLLHTVQGQGFALRLSKEHE